MLPTYPASCTTLSDGAIEQVFGTAVSTTVSSGDTEYDYGVVSGTQVIGGYQIVMSGGLAGDTTISSDGTM